MAETPNLSNDLHLLELLKQIAQKASYSRIAALCQALVLNPVVILDPHLAIVAQSETLKPEFTTYLQTVSYDQFYSFFSEQAYAITTNSFAFYKRQLFHQILFDGQLCGYLCFLEYKNKFDQSLPAYAKIISSALSGNLYLDRSGGRIGSSLQKIFTSLIRAVPDCPQKLKEQLFSNGWKESEKYYLIVIERPTTSSSLSLYTDLKAGIPTELYEYDSYYFSIIGREWKENLKTNAFAKLIPYLEKHKLRAGISQGFFDIANLSIAFHQCIKCIEFGRLFHYSPPIHMYENYIVTHLIEIMDKYTHYPVLSLCHPIVLKIRQYDAENHTDYLDILSAYLFSNLSIRRTAESLYMHPNTIYNRINGFEKIFGLRFDNIGLNASLLLSLYALAYLGLAKAESWNTVTILQELDKG